MAKFVCKVCGYIHEGDAAPARCPQCGVPADKFTKMEEKAMEFMVFAVIAVFGLVITEALMWAFTEKLGWYYMISKAVAAIIVLFWNFFMKKILLYRKK